MAFACTYAFWVIGAGFAITTALTVATVVAAVGLWGFAFMKFLTPSVIRSGEEVLWVIGPCLGIGALALFALRLAVPREIFLGLFVLLPLICLVRCAPQLFRDLGIGKVLRHELPKSTLQAFSLIGLTGVCLQAQWAWTLPIAMVAIGVAAALSSANIRTAPRVMWSWVFIIGALAVVADRRSNTWWMAAEGIPFDETILETFSKGLISFGPSVNPLHNSLSGLPAVAYHHLAYLVIGLADYFSQTADYEVLVVATPPFMALSLIASLILLIRRLARKEIWSNGIPDIVALGFIACLLSLRMLGAPSSWLGVVSVLASFGVIASVSDGRTGWREAALVATSLLVVAFSKGTSLFAAGLAAVVLPLLSFRRHWKTAFVGLATFLLVVLFFNLVSKDVASFRFEFWPYRNLASSFQFDFYTLKVFVNTLLLPVVTGIACSIFLLMHSSGDTRRWSLVLALILWSGIASQLFVTSTGPRSFEAFFAPAMTASGVLVLMLGTAITFSHQRPASASLLFLAICSLGYLLLSRLVATIESGSITFLSVLSAILVVGGLVAMIPNLLRRPKRVSPAVVIALLPACFLTALVLHSSRAQFQSLREISTINSYRFFDDWYGDRDLRELSQFMIDYTTTKDLFALSICDPELDRFCEPDFRIAALSGRKFLALHPLFSKDDVGQQTWADVSFSRSIGKVDPKSTITTLMARGVTHLIVEKSRVDDSWVNGMSLQESELIFENSSYWMFRVASA